MWLLFAIRLYPVFAVAVSGMSAGTSLAQSDDPPREFSRAWFDATKGTGKLQEAAIEALSTHSAWEPYFRTALNAVTDQKVRDRLRPVLERNRRALLTWNLERAKTWAKQLHFDYLADLAAGTDDTKSAAKIGTLVIEMQQIVHEKYRSLPLAWPGRQAPPQSWSFLNCGADYAALSSKDGFRRFGGDDARVPADQWTRPAMIHARTSTIAVIGSHIWIALNSTTPIVPHNEHRSFAWYSSVVCVNGSMKIANGSSTLFVCDGDVKLDDPASQSAGFSKCVIVANGDILGTREEIHANCLLYAAGDFSGKDEGYKGFGSLIVGGKIHPMPPDDHGARKYYRSGVKENPLGIRFVSPGDVGVELAVGPKSIQFAKVSNTSPLVQAGLRKGDVVVSMNGIAIATAADFRRQLRESLLWGAGLLEIRRGEETFRRLVTFAEPPKK